jgi:hypothetical protein
MIALAQTVAEEPLFVKDGRRTGLGRIGLAFPAGVATGVPPGGIGLAPRSTMPFDQVFPLST